MSSPVEVAVAILVRADGRVLLAQRPKGKVYDGYWEFPGGKVEPGESVAAALAREIDEELNIRITSFCPWITQVFTYPHATVRLNFFRVFAWEGEAHAVEHEGLSWERPEAVGVAPLLPANGPVLKGLQLPDEYAITQAAELGEPQQLWLLEKRLARGLRLVQVREKHMKGGPLEFFTRAVMARARVHEARVLINGDIELARRVDAAGVHLTSAQLAATTARPDLPWCAASCHTAADLRKAAELGLDFVVLGPVLATPSHPDATPLGWEGFAALAQGAKLPVYALGGMRSELLATARQHGAHGLAMLRASWAGRNL